MEQRQYLLSNNRINRFFVYPSNTRNNTSTKVPLNLAMLLIALIILALSGHVNAGDATRHYQIPAQSLNNALMRFAADSNLELVFTADKVRGMTANSLDGTMTADQALTRLLQGSGMTYRFINAHSVTLEQQPDNFRKTATTPDAPEPQSDSGEGQMMPKVTVEADAENAFDPDYYDDPYNKDYYRPQTSAGTKTDTPLLDTPMSITIATKKLMEDQQAIRVGDALKNFCGVLPGFSFRDSGGNEAFMLRGFSSEVQTNGSLHYREGIRLQGFPQPVAALDRIELLKGPATAVYGRSEPGGVINFEPKNALATPYYSVQQQFGSYDLYRTSADATGPLTKDGSLLYRFNLEHLSKNSFRDFIYNDYLNVAPNLTWNISDNTQVELEFDYTHNEFNGDYGIPAFGNRPAKVPNSFNASAPLGRNISDSYLVDLDIKHRFNDDWTFNFKGLYGHQDIFHLDIFGFGLNQDPTAGKIGDFGRLAYFEPNTDRDTWAASGYLTGKINLLSMQHTLLAGADYYNEFFNMPFFGPTLPGINIFNPVHVSIDESTLKDPNTFFDYRSFNRWWSVYLQDQIDITSQLKVLIGGRYDDTGYYAGNVPVNVVHRQRLNPRFGIVYQPQPWLSLYGHYIESLGTNNGRFDDNANIKPQISEEYEAGVKTESLDKRMSASLAYFYLTKQNILTPDPNNPLLNIVAGEARSQGIELEFTGEIVEGFRLKGAYTYMDTRMTKDTTKDESGNFTRLGKRLPNAPEHAGSLWATYEMQQGMWKGLNFGLGTYIVGDRQGDFENTFQMPGYVRLDAMLGYQFNVGKSKISTQVNVNNFLDKEYFKGSQERPDWILFGDPLTVLGSVRVQF